MNSIEEFEITIPRPPATISEQSFQRIRPGNFQQSINYHNSNYQHYNQSSPRLAIRPPNTLGSPVIRRPFYANAHLLNNTSNYYRPAVPVQNSLQNYQPRAYDHRPGLYASTISSSSNSVIHQYQTYRHPNFNSVPNFDNQSPSPQFSNRVENGQNQQPTRILQKPTNGYIVPPQTSNREKSLSSLNPATVTVSIPLTSLKCRPADMMDMVDSISKGTKTHIFAYDGGAAQDNGTSRSHAKYCIYGKWRDCFEAGKMLWKKLTKPYTAYIHESWLSFIDRKIPRSDSTLRNLYPVDIKHIRSMKVLAITGYYWDVLKIRKEFVLRQKKKVTKMSGDLLIVDYASDSGSEEMESIEILSQIKSDIDSSLKETFSRDQNLTTNFIHSLDKNNGNAGSFNCLKATEMMKLFIGPGMIVDDQRVQKESEELVNETEEATMDAEEYETDDLNVSISSNEELIKVPSVIFVPGESVPIFSSELYDQEEEEEVYFDKGKPNAVSNKTGDIETKHSIDESIRETHAMNNDHPFTENDIFETYDLKSDNIPQYDDENEPTILDDIDTLESIEFPTD